ncbi:MAG: hypothetical protein LBV30_03515 [Propionibacteriaceae bacterium]|jgi:hypothetical protein|nr:hypothetical protein [Propionibacteriaceae bacterium]
MLKFLKQFCIWLGIILIVATIGLVIWDTIQINTLAAVANANKSSSAGFIENPRNWVLLGVAAALIGGVVLGLGLGMPGHTFKQKMEARSGGVGGPGQSAVSAGTGSDQGM